MNVYKPIEVSLRPSPIYPNQYKPLNIYLKTYQFENGTETTTLIPLFNGRAWLDENGRATIYPNSVLKDYVFTPSFSYNPYYQKYVLEGVGTWNDLKTIERNTGKIFNGSVIVSVYSAFDELDVETTRPNVFSPSYNVQLNSYIYDTGVIFYNNIGCSITPEIPYIQTDNFFFGLSVGWDRRFRNDTISIGELFDERENIIVSIDGKHGNFFVAESVSTMCATVAGNAIYLRIREGGETHDVPIPKTIAVCNHCPRDYYIGWWTPWGSWQSQGFDRGLTKKNELKKDTMTTISNRETLINTETTTKYTLQRTCNKQMYELLSTIAISPCVYLYDTNNDFGTPVICTNNNIQAASTARLNDLVLEFTNIEKYNF